MEVQGKSELSQLGDSTHALVRLVFKYMQEWGKKSEGFQCCFSPRVFVHLPRSA